jgi:hypothetical protein
MTLRRHLAEQGELCISAGLFLGCLYGAIFCVVNGELGAAGYALFCAYGFFQALIAFADAAEMRRRMHRDQLAEDLQG